MLKIINGAQLINNIVTSNDPDFFGHYGRRAEIDYLTLLLDSQQYFCDIVNGIITPQDNFYIYAPSTYMTTHRASGIAVLIANPDNVINARDLYLTNPIKVMLTEDGNHYKYAGYDGRHRYVVAQKYHLDLLCYVIDDVDMLG